ncbi:relaxase/mobilization nuclease domain-containing protein [Komagataeibacter melomenusus]|uniref:relaxase/mobilization nuclease domain-containing protein n=1 Tax=Komagataeibacter melomenusus TaxID=2766578 RepID=UPI0038CF8394
MIIKSSIIKATPRSMKNVVRHLLDKPDENEAIGIINGSRHEVSMSFDDAEQFGRKNAVAHFIFSSKEALSPEQMRDAVSMVKDEFGFSSDDIKLTVRHQKSRHDEGDAWDQHFHMLVSMVNPENGKVMDVSKSFARQEKICRIFEAKHGLEIIKGKHNRAVISAVEDPEIREKLRGAGIGSGKRPSAAFTPTEKEVGKRRGHDLADVRNDLRDLWKRCDGWQAFNAAVQDRGWSIENGTKKPDVLILNDENGKYIGSVSRLLGMKKAELEHHMAESGPQKPQEAIPDVATSQTPDAHEKPSTGKDKTADGTDDKKSPVPSPAAPHGGKSPDVGPGRVQSTIKIDLKNKTEQERNAEIATEQAEAEKVQIANKSLQEQKKFYDEMLEMFSMKTGDKKMNTITLPKSFKTVCYGEIENFENIRDMPLPSYEMEDFEKLTDREKFDFAYKKVIDTVKLNNAKIKDLNDELKTLKENHHWWSPKGEKISSTEAAIANATEKMMSICVHWAKSLMSKFGLCDDPGPWRAMTEQEQNALAVEFKSNELAQAMSEIADMKETGYKKMAVNGVKMMNEAIEKWHDRPELHEARNGIVGIKSLLDPDEFAERVSELSDADKKKLADDIAGHDPCGAVKTLAAGEIHAADERDKERQREKAAELAEIREREQQKQKGQEQGKKGSRFEIA